MPSFAFVVLCARTLLYRPRQRDATCPASVTLWESDRCGAWEGAGHKMHGLEGLRPAPPSCSWDKAAGSEDPVPAQQTDQELWGQSMWEALESFFTVLKRKMLMCSSDVQSMTWLDFVGDTDRSWQRRRGRCRYQQDSWGAGPDIYTCGPDLSSSVLRRGRYIFIEHFVLLNQNSISGVVTVCILCLNHD